MDHPECAHMSTSVHIHLQYITFTYLVLYPKVLKKILKLSNDQWNPTLLDFWNVRCLDLLLAEHLVFRIRDVFTLPGVSGCFCGKDTYLQQSETGLKKGGQKSEEDLTRNGCEDWVCLAQRRPESWSGGERRWCLKVPKRLLNRRDLRRIRWGEASSKVIGRQSLGQYDLTFLEQW